MVGEAPGVWVFHRGGYVKAGRPRAQRAGWPEGQRGTSGMIGLVEERLALAIDAA